MDSKEKILRKLRGGGHRITRGRSAIIDYLLTTSQPSTAFSIYETLKTRGLTLDRATVYRELAFLVSNDVVRQLRLSGKATHYEIRSNHHHHLVCMKCNSVQDVVLGKHLEEHEQQILKRDKFKVVSHSLEFYGLCHSCNISSGLSGE